MPQKIIETVLKAIKKYDMISGGDPVVAAVSGGPDSVFLLHALLSLRRKLKIGEISVCNLDHGLRGKESEGDSTFVKKISNDLGLRFFHKKIDLSKAAKAGLSTEELAREERYKFYREAAEKAGAGIVATGHTLDDQAETVLMRIVKGSSLKGVVGMPPVRRDGDITFVRPLLELEKGRITSYLGQNTIPYRIDSTNLENIYFRNVVRNEIMPFLEKYNPRLKRSLFSLAEHLREDFEYITTEKEKLAANAVLEKEGSVWISLSGIVVQPKALQKEVLRDALGKVGGEIKKLTFRHWKDLEDFIKHKRRGNSIDLPGGVRVTRTDDALKFYRHKILKIL